MYLNAFHVFGEFVLHSPVSASSLLSLGNSSERFYLKWKMLLLTAYLYKVSLVLLFQRN